MPEDKKKRLEELQAIADAAMQNVNGNSAAPATTTEDNTAAQEAMSVATGGSTGVSPMVQNALDAQQATTAQQNGTVNTPVQRNTALTTQDFHNNTPDPDEDAKELQAIKDTNAATLKSFTDYINEQYEYKKQREEEMRREEEGNALAARWTGAAELGAAIANMIGVGSFGASNQQYHSYSQDWMKKADQDIKDNRKRRDDMKQLQDRLNLQLQELKSSRSIQELQLARQMRKEKEAKEKAERDEAFRREQFEWQKEKATKAEEAQAAAQARQDKATDADIAQGWARINQTKDNYKTQMLANGWVPDEEAPGGFRYDPNEAKKYGVTTNAGKDKKGEIEISLLANGSLPAEVIRVKDDATLKTTLLSNIDGVTDLLDSERAAIVNLMENDEIDASKKAEQLKRYLVKSGQLRSLFRGEPAQGSADTGTGWLFRQYAK